MTDEAMRNTVRMNGPSEGAQRRVEAIRADLWDSINERQLLIAPGVYDGLSARVAERAGFAVLYVSGGAVSRSTGVPDVGLMTMSEVLDRTREIVDAVDCPVIADADTGYGGVLNVARAVREFERIGVAGIHLEDQAIPKRCGHYEDKTIVEPGVMVARIRAALDARVDPGFIIIARTDARAVEGLEAALARAHRYAEAGADMLFIEAPQSEPEIETIAAAFDTPLVINMFQGGKTPLLAASHLQELGYSLVLVPSDLQRAAIHGMQRAAETLLGEGSTANFADHMVSFAERDRLVGLESYVELDDRYAKLERQP
jgi:2-methylisocitrate lyase-like PEP mutase family enzyme